MQNPCRRQAIITLFCECKTPAEGKQYIYWYPSISPYLGNVAKLIRRRRISLKRDNHLEPIPPQPTLNPSVACISAQTQAFCPGNVWASFSVELIPKNPPSKSLRQKHVILLCSNNNTTKTNLVLVSGYKTCFNINSNFIRIKYKYHYFNRNCPITMSVRGEHGVVKLIK